MGVETKKLLLHDGGMPNNNTSAALQRDSQSGRCIGCLL
jgi:hypothetical protein